MREIVEAWRLLRMARAVQYEGLRRRLVADHYALLEEAWIQAEPKPTMAELLVASEAVS